MAFRLFYQTQALNTAGALTCDNTPTIHATTNTTVNANTNGAGFTAPDLVSTTQGISIYVVAKGTGGTVTFNLQEATVTKATTGAINITSLEIGWNYIPLTVPYTYASLTATTYRYSFVVAGITGTTTIASATSSFSYMAWSDRNAGSLTAATDDWYIIRPLGTGAITCTVTGTTTTNGSGLTPVTIATTREVNLALYVGKSCTLKWDTTASATLTTRGAAKFEIGAAEERGTVATPYPAGRDAIWLFDQNAVSMTSGYMFMNGASCTRQGIPKSSTSLWKTTLSSGLGTAASPAIMSTAVDWEPGDEVWVAPTSNNAANYNEGEYRFIITKNSSTSYVWSATSGGAEAALANAHSSSAMVFNLQRNVLTKTLTSTTLAMYGYFQSTTIDEVNIDWARDETMGAFFNSRDGVRLTNAATHVASIDYSVAYNTRFDGYLWTLSTVAQTHTGLISAKQASGIGSGNVSGLAIGASNRTFVDCVAINSVGIGMAVTGSSNTFTRPIAIACNNALATTTAGGIYNAGGNNTFTNGEFHANGYAGVVLGGDSLGVYTSCLFGSKGTNTNDVAVVSTTSNLSYFNTCTTSSATQVANYLNAVPSTRISFQAFNSLNTNHITYYAYGTVRSTGAGLTDTNVRTAGTLNARIAAENLATGASFTYLVPAVVGRAVQALMFIQANAAFTGDASAVGTVQLYLPGSSTPDATATVSKADNNFNVVALAANYLGANDAFAKIVINSKTTTSAAYLYVADISNGTNTITALKPWVDGLPSPVMFEQLGDAAGVWQVLTSTLTTSGTTGKLLTKLLTVSKFLGLK